jgi:cobalt-zinc-cadmium efflux system membrane fusion protein
MSRLACSACFQLGVSLQSANSEIVESVRGGRDAEISAASIVALTSRGFADQMSEKEAQAASPVERRSWGRGQLLLAVGLALGIGADRFIIASKGDVSARSELSSLREEPILKRVGDRIVVPDGSPLRTRLTVAPVEMTEVSHKLVLPALVEVDPARTVKVLPPVTGRVTDLKVQLGARVTSGQELAVIDSGDLAQAYSDEEKARAQLKLTKQALDRLMLLEKTSAIAVKDREQAQSDYAQAQSEFERSDLRLRSIGVSFEQRGESRLLTLKAPVSGSIVDLQIAPGAVINDATAAVMTIANLDTIWVTANVPEKDTALVSTDESVAVIFPAYPGQTFNGKVLFVSDVLEPDTRRTKVRIAFNNPNKAFKPNMFANAEFEAPKMSRIVVPTSALLMANDRTSIFVEVGDWAFERRDVETEYQEGGSAVIKSGLQPDDRIVIKGGVQLND